MKPDDRPSDPPLPPPAATPLAGSRLDAIATQWSLVRDAHAAGSPQSVVAARQGLVLRYNRAIRRYVGGILRHDGDADELAQDVVVRLMKGDFGGANPQRGRFRDLLKVAVRNMTRNHQARAGRRRPADVPLEDLASDDSPDPAWDAEWRQAVLDLAWKALEAHERSHPDPPSYSLLRLRAEAPDATIAELADRLAARTGAAVRPDTCRQLLRRARLRFSRGLADELRIGLTDPSPGRVVEELAALGLLEYVRDLLPGGRA